MRRTLASVVTAVSVLLSLSVERAQATSYSWSFQDIGTSTGASTVALAMRTGATWPVVFSGSNSQVTAQTLTPVGWMSSGLGVWDNNSPLRSATGQDGRVGVAWQGANAIRFAQSGPGGWYQTSFAVGISTYGAADVAYLSGNRPVLAYSDGGYLKVAAYDGMGWNTTTVRIGASDVHGERATIAVDSQDRVYVAYMDGSYPRLVMKEMYSSTWTQWTGPTGPNILPYNVSTISLACGPHDEIGIAAGGAQTGYGVSYAWFAPQSGTWQVDQVYSGNLSNPSAVIDLAFDTNGNPALAYSAANSPTNLHYRMKVGLGWADVVVPDQAATQSSVAMAFDADNLPVLAYVGYVNNRPRLAYDPIVTPEPASLALVALGACVVARRRRGA